MPTTLHFSRGCASSTSPTATTSHWGPIASNSVYARMEGRNLNLFPTSTALQIPTTTAGGKTALQPRSGVHVWFSTSVLLIDRHFRNLHLRKNHYGNNLTLREEYSKQFPAMQPGVYGKSSRSDDPIFREPAKVLTQ